MELREIPIVREWIGWGIDEGREQERHAQLLRQSKILLAIVQAHFPDLLNLATQYADKVTDPIPLETATLKVSLAQSSQQASQALAELGKKAASGAQQES